MAMTRELLRDLQAQGYSHAPMVRQLLADFDTPLSVYAKLADAPNSYLFESVQGGDKWGRYSIIGLPCDTQVRVKGQRVSVWQAGARVAEQVVDDPLAWLEAYQTGFKVYDQPGLPKFCGGLVGYFGYDTVRYMEPRLAAGVPARDDLNADDMVLLVSTELVVFDNLNGQVQCIVQVPLQNPSIDDPYAYGLAQLAAMAAQLSKPLTPPQDKSSGQAVAELDFKSSFGEAAFKDAVHQIKDYILAGDAMQVVLSQQMSIDYPYRPLDLYRALRHLNPSPYLFYVNLDDVHIVGSSPEILVRLEDGLVTVRPIAGTRKRGEDAAADLALEQDLLADPKELAEHLMLIDLGRNDVGRIAQTGAVKLTEKMTVERYSHVMHIVSNVEAQVQLGLSAIDVLRATFPAGTVSGAPKVRAMEIIDELEPVKRGIYAGAVGYLGWHGNMDTAIAIRTAVIKDGRLFVQAGAGIVADSVAQSEWDETMNKGRAVFRAAAFVSQGMGADDVVND